MDWKAFTVWGLKDIPDGERGTDATVKQMALFVKASLRRPTLRLLAIKILNTYKIPNHNNPEAIKALFSWVKQNIRYLKDPVEVETVQDPEATIKLRAGDCDDQASLMAALAMSIGHAARFVVIGSHKDAFGHVYPEININGRWVPVDTVAPLAFGSAPKSSVKKTYSIEGESIMYLGKAATAVPIRVGTIKKVVYSAALKQLKSNWNQGLINKADVQGYIRVIDEGNSPLRNTIAETPLRQAISTFLAEVEAKKAVSGKPLGSINGLEGLDGFLGSLWNAIKEGVRSVVNAVTGGGKKEIQVTYQTPTTSTVVPTAAEATTAGITDMFKNPLVLGVGVLAILLLMRK